MNFVFRIQGKVVYVIKPLGIIHLVNCQRNYSVTYASSEDLAHEGPQYAALILGDLSCLKPLDEEANYLKKGSVAKVLLGSLYLELHRIGWTIETLEI